MKKTILASLLSIIISLQILNANQNFSFDSSKETILNFKTIDTGLNSLNFNFELDKNLKSACQYPNDNIHSGKEILPSISDKRRIESILELISKIEKCEKLPYKEDGQIFKNKEGKLPQNENGYYREYTLIINNGQQEFYIDNTHYTALPSLSQRGPERIVIGGATEIYYTPTHYSNFVKLNIK